jgi:CDP-4-dehydro-6-deoxyglucose reductase, E1
MRIEYGKNVYGKEEISAVVKQLKKTTQMSDSVKEFEKKIARIFEKKYGLMVNSGSSALTLAMDLIDIKKGDEIITPALNFGTAITSIIKANAKPIFVDIDVETLQISIEELKKKITKKTRALLIPNLIGNIPNWIKIKKIIKKYSNIIIIEDSADTLGARIGTKSTGYFSDISITSFYGSHVISCGGNGGLLLLDNKKFYEKAKVLRSWGRMSSLLKDSEDINKRLGIKLKGIEYDMKFVFSENGYNFEPSEIGAAFGLEQLKKFKSFSLKRNQNFELHKNFFRKYKELFILPVILKNVKTNFLSYPIIIKKNKFFNRKELQIYLENNNIQTRPIFTGNALRHPAFNSLISKRNKISSFKNADYIMKNGILIGCHQGLTMNNIKYIHKIINKFLSKYYTH